MSITIKVLNVTSTIHGLTNEQQAWVDNALSFFVKGAQFSSAYRKNRWDGRTRLYKGATAAAPFGKFSTGLLSRVLTVLADKCPGVEVNVIDERLHPERNQPIPLVGGIELRDYQLDTLKSALERGRGIYRLPTAGGKTLIEAVVMGTLNVPTLVLSHRVDIMMYLKEEFERVLGVPIGLIQGTTKELRKFNVGMIQTISNCFDKSATDEKAKAVTDFITEYCQCLIVDEAHHAISDQYVALFNRAYASFYRLGFSATPFRGGDEDMMVEAGLGKLQLSMTPSDLIKQGRLAKPYIFFVDYGDTSKAVEEVVKCHDCQNDVLSREIRPMAAEMERTVWVCTQCKKQWTLYMDNMERNLVRNAKRNKVIVALAQREVRKRRSVLIAVTHIAHGQILTDALCKVIDPALVMFAHGETENRHDILEKLRNKELLVVVHTNIFNEGINLQNLNTLITAKSSDSPIDIIQLAGRVLRRAKGKTKTVIIDFLDKSKPFSARSKHRQELLGAESEYVIKQWKYSPKKKEKVLA